MDRWKDGKMERWKDAHRVYEAKNTC